MKTITLVVDEATQRYLSKQAEQYGLSAEEYVINTLRQTLHKEWQRTVGQLAEAWKEFPDPEEVMMRTRDTRRVKVP